jgi:hypothetical protein
MELTMLPGNGDQGEYILHDVLATSDGLDLICEVKGRRFGVPKGSICAASEVRKPGDRGKLVIPRSLARNLGSLIARLDRARCTGVRLDGAACQADRCRDSNFCWVHDPALAGKREIARATALAGAREGVMRREENRKGPRR